jgi:LysR family transcriptional regulator, cys regulon transcriptional activator
MKLQQLRYIYEVARHELNVSATAESLYTSQPGVSKQIRLLEDELGVQIFTRSGKHLIDITPAGRQILEVAGRMLRDGQVIKDIARDYAQPNAGTLRLGLCPLAARYLVADRLEKFAKEYPKVQIQLRQGEESHFTEWLESGEVDLAIGLRQTHAASLVSLPCVRWRYAWLSRTDRARAAEAMLVFAQDREAEDSLHRALPADKASQRWVLVSSDPDVIKTYVRQEWGVGLLPAIAFDSIADSDLSLRPAADSLPEGRFWFSFRRDLHWRKFLHSFAHLLSPVLKPELLQQAAGVRQAEEQQQLVHVESLPVH